jgi:hypothetical protein
MPNIEKLAYFPKSMKDFLDFTVNGLPDGKGDWLRDRDGRKKVGVFNWLYGRVVPQAHFFTSDPQDPVQMFAATIERPELVDVPWIQSICGFEEFIIDNGELGTVFAFPSLSQPIATLKPNAELDQKFVDGRNKVHNIIETLATANTVSFNSQTLRAALRGDAGTNLPSLASEINQKLNLNLF